MIEINNLTTNPVDEEFLKKIVKIVLEGEHSIVGRGGEETNLSIVLVGQGRMRELNKKYQGKNRVTTVLTFGKNAHKAEPPGFRQKSKIVSQKLAGSELGEVVICLRQVKKNAKRCKTTFEKELSKVLIYGILHLLGYNHEKSEMEAKKMEEKQQYYLLKIGDIGEGSGEPSGSPV
jgi:probable rRNA maturation factor